MRILIYGAGVILSLIHICQKLDAAMDAIRMKFGNDKITRASIMNSNAGIGRKAKAQMENEENGKGF